MLDTYRVSEHRYGTDTYPACLDMQCRTCPFHFHLYFWYETKRVKKRACLPKIGVSPTVNRWQKYNKLPTAGIFGWSRRDK